MLLQDIRYALRNLWRSKAFATVATLCLGFGIGLNATIFSVIDGVLLKPYPYTDPDRILVVGEQNQRTDSQAGLSYLDMRDWNEANSVFTTIAGVAGRSLTISDRGGEPERYLGAAISWDLFPLLGTSPILGHGFTVEDDRPGAGPVVLLGYDLWTRRYHGDARIVGESILINGKPHVVIGVMPAGFAFPNNQRLWIPLAPVVSQDPRGTRGLFSFARMKPGVTIERARQDLDAIAGRLAGQYPLTNEGWTSQLRTLREAFLPDEVPLVLYLMMAGVTLVLFIACSNVANLLLARAAARRREISVRTALGAGRGRIVRQLLTESVVLGLISVPFGIVLAEVGTRLIAAGIPPDQVPYYVRWELDWRSVAYTVLIAATTALVFGLFPALQASRGNLHETLKEGTRGNSVAGSLLRSSLVVVQVAFALVSLVGALLFVRTFMNLGGSDLGFDTKPLMAMRFYLAGAVYEPEDAKLRRVEDVVRRVEALPGVRAAFASNLVPLSNGGGGGTVVVDGRPAQPNERAGIAFIGVTPHLNATLGLTTTRGRDFTEAEGWSHTPVAVINQTMATRFWPGADAVGGRFRLAEDTKAEWFSVDRRDAGRQRLRHRPVQRAAAGGRLRPLRLPADAQHGSHDSCGWRADVHHGGGARRASRLRSEHGDIPDADDQRGAAVELLAVRALRLDLRNDRRDGSAARGDWCLRCAVVLRLAADAGDRRAGGARCRPRRYSPPRGRSGTPAGRHRHRRRAGALGRGHAARAVAALQGEPVRSAHVQRRGDVPRAGRVPRELRPGAARNHGRSRRGVARGVTAQSSICWTDSMSSTRAWIFLPRDQSWNTRKAPRRSALLAGFVMIGAWPKAYTKSGFATKQAARQPLKRAKARPIAE